MKPGLRISPVHVCGKDVRGRCVYTNARGENYGKTKSAFLYLNGLGIGLLRVCAKSWWWRFCACLFGSTCTISSETSSMKFVSRRGGANKQRRRKTWRKVKEILLCTYLSADEAIRLAISEYLHVDCRLTQAKQWGRVRSHCGHGQRTSCVVVGLMHRVLSKLVESHEKVKVVLQPLLTLTLDDGSRDSIAPPSRLLLCLLGCSFVRSFVRSLAHSLTQSFRHSPWSCARRTLRS